MDVEGMGVEVEVGVGVVDDVVVGACRGLRAEG